VKFQISNKTFYSRHSKEISRFVSKNQSLHIVNAKSKYKINESVTTDILYLEIEKIEAENLIIDKKYDVIILTDIVEVHPDIFNFFKLLSKFLNDNGKLVITSFNSKYKIIIKILERLKLKDKTLKYSYIHNDKINNIISGNGFDYINSFSKQILPFKLFGLGTLLNRILESLFFLFNLGIKTYSIYRLKGKEFQNYKKTIIIPAKNEEGNLENIIDRIPKVEKYEIIIPCGISEDNTVNVAKMISDSEDYFQVTSFIQSGKGKANAVWEAIQKSSGDVLAILDADISVDPETIPDFFEIIDSNNADFVNGTRLIYQMEKGAMRYINHLGNRLFQFFVGGIVSYPLTDSLCGTKVFKRELYDDLIWWQKKLKYSDPFGDFDLIFTAAFTGRKIIEYPIHYRSRTYGSTQISRFKDGFKLIKYLIYSFFVFRTSS